MDEPTLRRLNSELRKLVSNTPGAIAAALVNMDGLTITSTMQMGPEEEKAAAMTAAMMSLGERSTSALGMGELQQAYFKGKDGYILLKTTGKGTVLSLTASSDARLGLVFVNMDAAIKDFEKML